MSKKTLRVILFGIVAGITGAFVYHYLKNCKNSSKKFDDFDDLDVSDDGDATVSEKSYITLDGAKAVVADTIDKAKGALDKASKKLHETIKENETSDEDSVEDVTEEIKSEAEESEEISEEDAEGTEEFFDDDEA